MTRRQRTVRLTWSSNGPPRHNESMFRLMISLPYAPNGIAGRHDRLARLDLNIRQEDVPPNRPFPNGNAVSIKSAYSPGDSDHSDLAAVRGRASVHAAREGRISIDTQSSKCMKSERGSSCFMQRPRLIDVLSGVLRRSRN